MEGTNDDGAIAAGVNPRQFESMVTFRYFASGLFTSQELSRVMAPSPIDQVWYYQSLDILSQSVKKLVGCQLIKLTSPVIVSLRILRGKSTDFSIVLCFMFLDGFGNSTYKTRPQPDQWSPAMESDLMASSQLVITRGPHLNWLLKKGINTLYISAVLHLTGTHHPKPIMPTTYFIQSVQTQYYPFSNGNEKSGDLVKTKSEKCVPNDADLIIEPAPPVVGSATCTIKGAKNGLYIAPPREITPDSRLVWSSSEYKWKIDRVQGTLQIHTVDTPEDFWFDSFQITTVVGLETKAKEKENYWIVGEF